MDAGVVERIELGVMTYESEQWEKNAEGGERLFLLRRKVYRRYGAQNSSKQGWGIGYRIQIVEILSQRHLYYVDKFISIDASFHIAGQY